MALIILVVSSGSETSWTLSWTSWTLSWTSWTLSWTSQKSKAFIVDFFISQA